MVVKSNDCCQIHYSYVLIQLMAGNENFEKPWSLETLWNGIELLLGDLLLVTLSEILLGLMTITLWIC